MDDLDLLLEDLGRARPSSGKSTIRAPNAPPPTASSQVDLSELESLMDELSAPAPLPTSSASKAAASSISKAPSASKVASSSASKSPSKSPAPTESKVAAPVESSSASKAPPSRVAKPPPTRIPEPAKVQPVVTPQPVVAQPVAPKAAASDLDDLDALMASLETAGPAEPKTIQQPASYDQPPAGRGSSSIYGAPAGRGAPVADPYGVPAGRGAPPAADPYGAPAGRGSSSIYGQPAGGRGSPYAQSESASTSSIYGQPAGRGSPASPQSAGSPYGQPAGRGASSIQAESASSSSIYGQPATSSPYGQPAGRGASSIQAEPASSSSSIYGQPAGGRGSPVSPSPYGQPAGGRGSPSPYGQPPSSSPYDQPAAASPYGQPAGGRGSSYGQPAASSPYGQPAASSPAGGRGSAYGQPAASSPYGQSAASSPYGQPAASSPYGQPAAKNSPYGQPAGRNPPPSGGIPGHGDDLDALLTNLSSQMENLSDPSVPSRGVCGTCKRPILGEMMQAMGKTYHPEHFVCGNCQDPLGTRNFYEVDGQPNCDKCYQGLFCPKCGHCNRPILDRCITALGKKWHPEHFVCASCSSPFPGGSFFERDNRPFCESCFYGGATNKCGSCLQPIRADSVTAMGNQWHPECFVCQTCRRSFAGASYFEVGGLPYCELHYHQQSGSICAGCNRPIAGQCITALDKKWHPEHFICAFCMRPLSGTAYSEIQGKAYCKDCHSNLF